MGGRWAHFTSVPLVPQADVSEVWWSQQPTGLPAFIPFVGGAIET